MDVKLTPALDAFVRTKMETGLFDSESEVVREALRLMLAHEKAKREHLLDMIDQADREFAAGEFTDYGPDQVEKMLTDAGW